jgi:formate hydrogenlyase transcriptional activator
MHVVWRTGEPLLVHDAEREPQWRADPYVIAARPRSMLGVPILHKGRRRGVLYLENRLAAGAFTAERVEMMRFLAGEAGLALENATLYEALREALREVERLKNRLLEENVYLQEEIRTEHNFEEIVGRSPLLLAALRKIEQVAATDATVLILGETGTGKELFARAIHDRSPRKARPLVKVNCGAIPTGLVESELFGHVKGAFTGALQNRTGRFQLAHGGTLFLDEVGELPPDTQVKLLRALQEQEFEPVGGSRTVRVDVRVIAATNRDLAESVRGGSFRADLLYRLNVFPIEIPPLRDRADDVSLLAAFFLSRIAKRLGKPVKAFSRQSVRRMLEYPWPGNVRELQNIVERAVILSDGPLADVDARLLAGVAPQVLDQRARTLEQLERSHIVETLRATGGVIEGPRGAARILDVHPNTLRSRMKKLGIEKSTRNGGPGLAGHDIS